MADRNLKMASVSKGRKTLLTRFLFQPPATRSRRDSTMVPLNSWGWRLDTLKEFGVGNHLSDHILTHCPFPMLHRCPLSRTFLPANKLLHVYDGFRHSWASMKLLSGKYLTFRILWVRDPGFWMSLHPCFASKAKLKALRSLNPIPPSTFGLHIFSQ